MQTVSWASRHACSASELRFSFLIALPSLYQPHGFARLLVLKNREVYKFPNLIPGGLLRK